MNVAVGHQYGIVFSENVLPRSYGRIALTNIDITGLTIEVTKAAIGQLYHVGSPNHLGRRPVHDDVLPVDEVLAHPHLCRTVTVACTVGSGIEVIGIAELTNGGVGKVTWDKRVARSRRVPTDVVTLCMDSKCCP